MRRGRQSSSSSSSQPHVTLRANITECTKQAMQPTIGSFARDNRAHLDSGEAPGVPIPPSPFPGQHTSAVAASCYYYREARGHRPLHPHVLRLVGDRLPSRIMLSNMRIHLESASHSTLVPLGEIRSLRLGPPPSPSATDVVAAVAVASAPVVEGIVVERHACTHGPISRPNVCKSEAGKT